MIDPIQDAYDKDNRPFIDVSRSKAIATKEEIKKLIQEQHRLTMEEARARLYLKKLNAFLITKGQKPVDIPEEEV